MTSDGIVLFRAVCENPGDDTPRLAYADWLEENGQPERAEFIRLQCEAWSINPAYPDRTSARTRASQLSKQYGDLWHAELPEIAGVIWSDLFVRGFIDRAWIAAQRDVTAQLQAVFAATPVQYLTVIDFGTQNLAIFLQMDEVGRLSTLKRERRGSGFSKGMRTLMEIARQRFPRTEFL